MSGETPAAQRGDIARRTNARVLTRLGGAAPCLRLGSIPSPIAAPDPSPSPESSSRSCWGAFRSVRA